MKSIWTVLFGTTLLCIVSGFALWEKNKQIKTNELLDLPGLEKYLDKELNLQKPRWTISLKSWFNEEHRELLNPQMAYAFLPKGALAEARDLEKYAKTCASKPTVSPKSLLYKSWVWHQFICKHIVDLPKDFFETKPWMHPSGQSYAWLGLKAGFKFENLKGFHVSEWQFLPFINQANEATQKMSGLSENQWLALFQSEPLIPVGNDIWKLISKEDVGDAAYEIYSVEPVSKILKAQGIGFHFFETGDRCSYQRGAFCWNVDRSPSWKWFRSWVFIVLGASILSLVWVFHRLVLLLKDNRKREQHKQLVLHSLVHELRTPLANLGLSFEEMKTYYDQLPMNLRDAFMGQLNSYHRLVRMSERSRQYLKIEQGNRILIQKETLESIQQWVQDLVERLDISITTEFEGEQKPVSVDPHWLEICLSNLFSNAKLHGKPPIKLRVIQTPHQLSCEVSDQGVFNENIQEASSGLGLGLIIVRSLIKEMNGSLESKKNPTTWILRIPI